MHYPHCLFAIAVIIKGIHLHHCTVTRQHVFEAKSMAPMRETETFSNCRKDGKKLLCSIVKVNSRVADKGTGSTLQYKPTSSPLMASSSKEILLNKEKRNCYTTTFSLCSSARNALFYNTCTKVTCDYNLDGYPLYTIVI